MTRLPTVSPKQVVAALKGAGFIEDHQTGSHLVLIHPNGKTRTTVAMHSKDLPRPILKKIIKQAGLTEDEFRKLL